MSQSIVVKSCLNDDLRRFTVKNDCSWTEFKQLLAKLYEVDIFPYRITYKDEEGDDVTITTDEELAEAFRQTSLMTLKVLRLNLIISTSTPKSLSSSHDVPMFNFGRGTEDRVSIPVVYVSGRAFVPTSTPVMPDYGPKKSAPEHLLSKMNSGTSTVQKELGPVLSPPITDPSLTPSPISPTPLVVVINPSEKQSLSAFTASLAESISKMVLDSSNSILRTSVAASDSILHDTELIANTTGTESLEISSAISRQTQELSKQSIVVDDTATLKKLNDISEETSKLSSDMVASTTASVQKKATAILDSLDPISQQTRSIQYEATEGMGAKLDRDSEALVRMIMSVTTKIED